ncbi:MAG: DUF1772 domain-containing protein [Ignavibacteriae bacterium]|nr:DUF1772 domain-containing protein [Ignavibacteriota bacterium]NOH00062.1 DUF1772 domain-containing protein [Ignavibacteriota bacterium]
MEISLKTIVLFGAVILTGLSAGFFYAWSVSVIQGTKRVDASTYLETMQSVNRAILNPAFFLIFFGSLILLIIGSIYQFDTGNLSFWFMLMASLLYLIGTVVVTGLGNVPLNNQLDALNLNKISSNKILEFRKYYESKWNRLHLIRTIFAVFSFLLSVAALFTQSKNI